MSEANCLISYPRSGNTLLRFLIEYITERVVVDFNEDIPDSAIDYLVGGNLEVKPKNPPILRKFHLVDPTLNEKELIKDSKVTLIIRDYYDAIVSHSKRGSSRSLDDQIKDYCSLLRYYDWSKNQATFIYYEDLINLELQPDCIKKILDSNDITERPNWQRYLDNIEELNSKSKKGYIRIYNNISAHDHGQKDLFTQAVKYNAGSSIFRKYLTRYDENS